MSDVFDAFDRGAQDFERLAPALWNPMGNAVVAAADISLAERVLDACCGSGASTIPAAQLVGPAGVVDAVDLSAGLLELAQGKAEAMSLGNIRFAHADVTSWSTSEPYDAILCCYGLFFFADMASGTLQLARLLRPGGRLALSTWDEGAHQPFKNLIREACTAVRPELESAPPPVSTRNLQAIGTAGKLQDWLLANGFSTAEVDAAPFEVPLDASMAWSLVLGSGYRTLLPDNPETVEDVRQQFLHSLGEGFVLNANSIVAVATVE